MGGTTNSMSLAFIIIMRSWTLMC